jgi:hypothetical protein
MIRRTLLLCASILAVCGCDGAMGPAGTKGDRGDPGTDGVGDPSISAVTPSGGYLGRTIDIVVSGQGTAWAGDTTVSFSDPSIQVNSVTAASETGLLVNVTIPPGAMVGAADVMVTDAVGTETYKGAFKVMSPLEVTVEPAAGLPQGGVATLRVRMLDTTTPFDEKAIEVAFGSQEVGLVEVSEVTPYGMDVTVESDVLATAGNVDVTVTSGPDAKAITSPLGGAFQVATRAPIALAPDTPTQGEITEIAPSLLYSYTPADANAHFVQVNLTSTDGGPTAMLVPKSGKRADALGSFEKRFAVGTTSADPFYVLVRDGRFGVAPPYGATLFLRDIPCTAMTETAGNVDPTTANEIVAIPSLVSGALIEGMSQSDDWFKVVVTGATLASPKSIHVATGGDALSDMLVDVFDTDGATPLGYTDPDAIHKELFVPDIAVDGTYFVRVSPGFFFDATHAGYDLLVEVL